jgi:uncharacterized protein
LRGSFRCRFYLKAFGVTEQGLLDKGDSLVLRRLSETLEQSRRVSGAVIMAMDSGVRPDGEPDQAATEIHIPDEFVASEVRRYPNLLFGARINPYRRDALRRLESAVENNAVLLKWLPSIVRHVSEDIGERILYLQ